MDTAWKRYKKKNTQLMRPYVPGEDMSGISDLSVIPQGGPRKGDMIAVANDNADDKWVVSAEFFKQNYEEVS